MKRKAAEKIHRLKNGLFENGSYKLVALFIALSVSACAMAQMMPIKKELPQPFKGGNDAMLQFFKDSLQVSPAIERAVVANAGLQEVAGKRRGFLGPNGEHLHRGVEAVGGQAEIRKSIGHLALGFGRRGQLYFIIVARGFSA